jgi:hypothetical protein
VADITAPFSRRVYRREFLDKFHVNFACLSREEPGFRRRGDESVSEGGREFDDLEWIVRLTSHIPERDALTVS